MARVVVVGGGWSGCAAAIAAVKMGCEAVILEKTDAIIGTGLVGGIMRNNGRYTAAEEMIAMGGGDLFQACDRVATHTNLDFPDHRHASLYNVTFIEPEVRDVLDSYGIQVMYRARVTGVKMEGRRIRAVTVKGAAPIMGDVFVDATGSAGPPGSCTKFGEGCMMCVLRCPTFGGRVGLAGLCGVEELQPANASGKVGAFSGSCKIAKESMAPWVVKELEEKGKIVLPLPEHMQDKAKLGFKACQQYAGGAYAENVVILDTGHAKLMAPYMALDKLHSVPGLEKARYLDPYAGGLGNSVRFTAMVRHNKALLVDGVENLFCGGEKAGPLVGHTEAITSGTVAGHNAARQVLGMELLVVSESTAVGDSISHVTNMFDVPGGLGMKYTYSGSVYFERMLELGLYTTDHDVVRERVRAAGMENIFAPQGAAVRQVAAG